MIQVDGYPWGAVAVEVIADEPEGPQLRLQRVQGHARRQAEVIAARYRGGVSAGFMLDKAIRVDDRKAYDEIMKGTDLSQFSGIGRGSLTSEGSDVAVRRNVERMDQREGAAIMVVGQAGPPDIETEPQPQANESRGEQ